MFKNKKLSDKLEKSVNTLEKSNLLDVSYTLGTNWEIFKKNLLAGLARGVGMGIGFTAITAILILFLNHLVTLNIPIIGEYIRDIVDIVEKSK